MEKERRVPVSEKAYAELEKKAKTGGKTPDQVASEIVIEKSAEKSKAKRRRKAEKSEPNSGKQPFVNKYGFLRLPKSLQEKFGIQPGRKTPVSITVEGDALIIRKA